jgi:hypothetical protein
MKDEWSTGKGLEGFLERARNATTHFNQDTSCLERDSNLAPPEYQFKAVSLNEKVRYDKLQLQCLNEQINLQINILMVYSRLTTNHFIIKNEMNTMFT